MFFCHTGIVAVMLNVLHFRLLSMHVRHDIGICCLQWFGDTLCFLCKFLSHEIMFHIMQNMGH